MLDRVGEDPGGRRCVVEGEVEPHPGGWGEGMRGVPGEDGPARPVSVGDGGDHAEGADLDDGDWQIRDPGGGPDEGLASLVVVVFGFLAILGVPGDAADPAVGG